jgi:hypothetical protein
MRKRNLTENLLVCLLASSTFTSLAARTLLVDSATKAQIHVPNRPPTSLFEGRPNKQKTEISFDPATKVVTVKMLVQDPNGYFIPNIRRENFAVYEDGVRQQNAKVEVEHAPVSIGILLEYGGRFQAMNKAVGEEVSRAAHQFLDEIGREDKVAIWKYGGQLEALAGFSEGHERLERQLGDLRTPPLSEVNFYDALVTVLDKMREANGRYCRRFPGRFVRSDLYLSMALKTI